MERLDYYSCFYLTYSFIFLQVKIICDIYQIQMSFFSKFFKWLPSPFQNIRKHLNIQQQWQEFKHHIRPHKTKIYIGVIFLSYPLYSNYAKRLAAYTKYHLSNYLNNFLNVDQPPFQITENFAKNLISSIFSDENVKHEGLEFVNSIIQEQKFVDDILHLLVSALKNAHFMQSLQGSSKQLTLKLLADADVQKALKTTVVDIVGSPQVKESLIKLIESTFTTERSIKTIVQLLQKSISNQEVKHALSGSINYSVQQLLKDEQMINQLKIFIFFLLRKFESDDEIKSMMDILFAKGLGLTKKKKDNELKKLLKDIDNKRTREESVA